jgi:hypothetical protein
MFEQIVCGVCVLRRSFMHMFPFAASDPAVAVMYGERLSESIF